MKLAEKPHRPKVDPIKLRILGAELIRALGLDPQAPGLQDTPRRWAAWWSEFMDYEPGNTETSFEAVTADQMVVLSGIRVHSLCEHHLLPFVCDIAIGYISEAHILGISKLARIAHLHAHRPQVQERLVKEIADSIQSLSGSSHVAVLASGSHLCMSMRGIRTDARMVTSETRGLFRESAASRAEFLRLAGLM